MGLFPVSDLRLPSRHQRRGLWDSMSRVGPSLETCESLLSCRECLVRMAHALAQSKGIALHNFMHAVEEIGHTEALQPLLSELNECLGPVADHIEDLGSQSL